MSIINKFHADFELKKASVCLVKHHSGERSGEEVLFLSKSDISRCTISKVLMVQ